MAVRNWRHCCDRRSGLGTCTCHLIVRGTLKYVGRLSRTGKCWYRSLLWDSRGVAVGDGGFSACPLAQATG